MTEKDVLGKLEEIDKVAEKDYEAATILERNLWFDVLAHIAANSNDYGYLAELALKTTEHEFYRGSM